MVLSYQFAPRLLLGALLPLAGLWAGLLQAKPPELAKGQDNLLCQPFYIQHTQRQTPTPTINLRLASNPPILANSALASLPSYSDSRPVMRSFNRHSPGLTSLRPSVS